MTEIIEGWIEYNVHHHGWFKGYFRLYNGGVLQRFDHPKNPACRFRIDLNDVYDSMCIGSYTLKMAGLDIDLNSCDKSFKQIGLI
jgi:hypothetical protein